MDSTPLRHSRPQRRRSFSSRGFTIMEVAIASFVMAFGLSTAVLALQAGYKYLDVARDTTLASQILQSEIERIRMMSWTGVTALVPPAGEPQEQNVDLSTMFTAGTGESTTAAEARFAAILARRFKVTRTVTLDSTRPAGAGVATITIRVQWTSFDGRTLSRQFQATYAQQGLYDYFYTKADRRPIT